MAKRGANAQLTKDDERSDDEDASDPGVRDTPLAPIEGRQIRGMPKRRGLGGTAPAPAAPSPAPAASSNAFSSFSFGGAPSAGSNPFVFGAGTPAPAPAASAPTFGAAPVPAPAASASTPAAPAPANPFAGFAFAAKPAAPSPSNDATKPAFSFGAPSSAPAPAPEAPKKTFGFGAPSTAPPAASTPVPTSNAQPPKASASPFGFGAKADTPSAPAPSTQPPKPFAGFSFNAPSAPAPSPAPAASSDSAPSTSSPFAFGSSSATTSKAPVSFSAVQNSSAEPDNAPPTPVSKSPEPVPSQSTLPDEKQVSYYTSLRGLNTSFLTFLSSSLDSDPFLDLTVAVPKLLKQYTSYVEEAGKKAGWQPEGEKPAAVNGSAAKAANGFASLPAPPAVGGFALPKPPTASSSSTPTPSFGGFTPSLPAAGGNGASSPFSFGGAKPSAPAPAPAAQTPKKPSAEVTQLVQDVISGKADAAEEKKETAPKPFSFGATTSSSATDSAKKPTALFSFSPSGPLHPPTPDSKSFAPSSSVENVGTPAKLGKFGPGGSQPQLSFGGAKGSPSTSGADSPVAAKPFSFGFGSGSGPSTTAASSGGTGFSFGSSSSTPASAGAAKPAFSFGGSTQASSTPAFSFGGKPAATTSASAPAASGSGFSFAPYTPKPAAETNTPDAEGSAGDADGQATPGSPSKNLAETAGAGEENEETVVEQRGKLHSLEDGKFKVEGLGQFKLKRAKEGGKRRLLMRTDGSGNVILNMSVNGTFKATAEGTTVRFLGFNKDGKPTPYALRVKNAQTASELQTALQKEVDGLKAE